MFESQGVPETHRPALPVSKQPVSQPHCSHWLKFDMPLCISHNYCTLRMLVICRSQPPAARACSKIYISFVVIVTTLVSPLVVCDWSTSESSRFCERTDQLDDQCDAMTAPPRERATTGERENLVADFRNVS